MALKISLGYGEHVFRNSFQSVVKNPPDRLFPESNPARPRHGVHQCYCLCQVLYNTCRERREIRDCPASLRARRSYLHRTEKDSRSGVEPYETLVKPPLFVPVVTLHHPFQKSPRGNNVFSSAPREIEP